MNFEDERYVRVYTRDTSTWQFLRWEGQAVFVLLLRKVDRVGVFDLCGADPVDAVTAMLGMPEDAVRVGLERLLKFGVLEKGNDCLVVAKFIEAQEASMSPTARQKESRLRRRDQIRQGLDPAARETVIYFVQSEHGGSIKIGRADDLAKRLVGLQTSRPDKLVVLASAPGTLAQERELHARFADAREKGEWFTPVPELVTYIKKVAKTGNLVTDCDESHIVTDHETSAVTPNLAVLNLAVPDNQPSVGVAPARRKRLREPADIPATMSLDWNPPESVVEAQATRWQVSKEQLLRTLPEFRDFWMRDGARKSKRGWITAWTNRLSALAKRGELWVDNLRQRPQGGAARPPVLGEHQSTYSPPMTQDAARNFLHRFRKAAE